MFIVEAFYRSPSDLMQPKDDFKSVISNVVKKNCTVIFCGVLMLEIFIGIQAYYMNTQTNT